MTMTARDANASTDVIRVELGARSYDIIVGEGLLATLGSRR